MTNDVKQRIIDSWQRTSGSTFDVNEADRVVDQLLRDEGVPDEVIEVASEVRHARREYRQAASLLVADLISVQPMSIPSNLAFDIEYTYGSGSGSKGET